MSTAFPLIEIPAEFHVVVGAPDLGTRIYRKTGPQEQISYWHDAIVERFGHAVSPGGVAMFAPVSRAAVHKRIKEGKLTCFLYDITHRKRNLFGFTKEVRELNVAMIPVSECKAWGQEIEKRAIEKGLVTQKELTEDRPDWDGLFLPPESLWTKGPAKKGK